VPQGSFRTSSVPGTFLLFARRIDRLSQTIFGESLLLEVRAYLALWVARGLDEVVLKAVCAQALNLSV
jgi:hypothetical protein